MTNTQIQQRLSNYLRPHRRKIGLTQRELARVLGFPDQSPVSRHERFHAMPPLQIAIGYEVIFRVPVSEIFAGLRDQVAEEVESRLEELENGLEQGSMKDRGAIGVARKLTWLSERKDSQYEPVS